MTRVTQEAQGARRKTRQGHSAAMNALMNNIFNPYTALCVVLVLSGVGVALLDAKGIALLLVAAFMAALVRLLWTIREELRESNSHLQAQVQVARAAALRPGGRE